MIEFKNVLKYYGDLLAVDNLSLAIPTGSLFGLLGPNGAGKTTSIRLLTGLAKPTAGTICVNNLDIEHDSLEVKRLFGYVPDQPYLYDKLTALELMWFVGGIYQLSNETVSRKTDELFDLFEIQDIRNKRIGNLSLGIRQKLLIATAFVHEPKIFVIDEPMVGLDPYSIDRFKKFLRDRVSLGMTIFISTHNIPVAEELCDRFGIIHKGKLLANGTLSEISSRLQLDNENLADAYFQLTRELQS
ncbi:MAG: ABC transporter ATP-binding protein [Candidatus Marinimicrobia bacterium]|nr:ABC transporter ATP-binding protein [Candidatus Neomarinimicrobiota bacterium]